MEDAAPYSMYNAGYLDTSQPQIPHEIQVNHDHTVPIPYNIDQVNGCGRIAVETTDSDGDFDSSQATQLNLDVGLASMTLEDGGGTQKRTQDATLGASLDPSCIVQVEGNVSVGAAFDACLALKNELGAALNAYRQSREVMLWHAANVCRLNMEYIRALRAANANGVQV